ncbi:ATP-binding protein [Streptomyces sp. B1I3]|uniref:ATP-binding protein n=1 Tax=Streptomyces sp. B1I3 TaxID=3042264 RepID=UPI00358FCBD0
MYAYEQHDDHQHPDTSRTERGSGRQFGRHQPGPPGRPRFHRPPHPGTPPGHGGQPRPGGLRTRHQPLRHGGGHCHYTLELSAGPDTVTAAVSDSNPAHPHERKPDLGGDSGGFGWHMIRRLTNHLTIAPSSGGKTIHAQLSR